MKILEAVQGSPAWHDHRRTHFNASDAPAMMGLSPYKTRSELLRELATGITAEIDPATQRRFDDGHRFESLARPMAEQTLGEDLFPVVGYEGRLSASFDGLTMDGVTCWEHKTINDGYRNAIANEATLPAALLVQIEQQLMISGAENCLFTATRWDGETCVEAVDCFVESDTELRKAIIQGWTQFAIDLEAYEHTETVAAPVASSIEALPALMIQVEGKVLATNLDQFQEAAHTFIANIKTELSTDQDFADADKMVKFLKDGEDRLALCKDQAQSQAKSIDALFRTIDSISEQMRSKRLALDKLVKAEKTNRKAEIINQARKAIDDHIDKLNQCIGGQWVKYPDGGLFAAATTGLKSLDSMRDKVAGALANAKIEANEVADRIQDNRSSLDGDPPEYGYWMFLFPDFASVCTKARDDFAAMLDQRIAKHEEQQSAEREKIRKEEADKIAKQAAQSATQAPATPAAAVIQPQAVALAPEAKRAVLVDSGDEVRAYLNTLDVSDKERGRLRAVIMGFIQFRTEMIAAA